MLEEDVHGLPQRVVQDLDHLLVHERDPAVGHRAHRRLPCREARTSSRPRVRASCRARPDFRIAFGRTEAHHDVFGLQHGFEPGAERRSRDRARAARACRRSPDARIPPRRAAHRWRRGRGRRPAAGRRAEIVPTSRGRRAPGARPRARRTLAQIRCARAAALPPDSRSLAACHHAIGLLNRSAAADRRPACPRCGCRRSESSPAPCPPAAREPRR